MSGAQRAAFQEMSLEMAAQGWLSNGDVMSSLRCVPQKVPWDYAPAKQDDHRVAFRRNEAEHEDVLAATVVALGCGLAEGTLGV